MSFELRERAPIYAWLAERLAREIDGECWRQVGDEPLRSTLGRLEPNLVTELDQEFTAERQETLEEEYARLFLLPGGVSPLASSWVASTDDRESARQRITHWIDGVYAALGREPRRVEPWGKLPLDHLAVVLDLVAVAATSGDQSDLEVANLLHDDLLSPALVGFGAALVHEARTPIYRSIGALITSLKEHD